MNILIINHYARSTKHGIDFKHHYLAKEWQELDNSWLPHFMKIFKKTQKKEYNIS